MVAAALPSFADSGKTRLPRLPLHLPSSAHIRVCQHITGTDNKVSHNDQRKVFRCVSLLGIISQTEDRAWRNVAVWSVVYGGREAIWWGGFLCALNYFFLSFVIFLLLKKKIVDETFTFSKCSLTIINVRDFLSIRQRCFSTTDIT